MPIPSTRNFGWKKPTPEQTIRALLGAHPLSAFPLPPPAPTSDNSALCCSLDQGAAGSCTSNECAQVLYMEMVREGILPFVASRLATYWWNRNKDGNANTDSGASVGGTYAVVAQMGVPRETLWPYNLANLTVEPPPQVYQEAFDRRGKINVNYFPLAGSGDPLLLAIERVLTTKRGVGFGVEVTEKFCSTMPSGIVQAPGPNDQIAGSHAITNVGHNAAERWFLIKNSWGDDWGEPGYPPGCFRMSYDYMLLASDFWFAALSAGGAR